MSRYWKNRGAENLKRNKLTEEQYKAEVEKIYNRMLRDIQREIDSFYGRYATKEGITIAEAKKRVSKLDMDDYERKAKQYVKDRDFSDLANDEMRLYNLTMKVSRLEMLKSRIGLEILAGHDDLEKFMEEILKGRTMDELERQAGILGESVIKSKDLDKMVSSIVNGSFHNANFSQRIWTNEAVMKIELDKLLKQGLIQGKGARELARSLRTLCGVSQRNAERLMITELARVQIEAQKLSYKENGFDEYEYIAEPTACPICKAMDGKHFKVAKMLPGENAAPMHPYCRCSTAPYSDRKEFDEWLNHLEKGGTTEQWNRLKNDGIKAFRAKRLKDEEGFTYNSKSDILIMESIEDVELYFSDKYGIDVKNLKGCNRTLDGIKVFLAGVDDFLSLFPEVGANIRKITFGTVANGSGEFDSIGKTITVNTKGIGSYVTGFHESVHAFDDFMSLNARYGFSAELYEIARKKLKYRKNGQKLERAKIEIVGFSNYTESEKTYELLAYSFEHKIDGSRINDLSDFLVELAKEKYNERFKK